MDTPKFQFRRSLIAFAATTAFARPAMAVGETTRVSVASDGTEGNSVSYFRPSMSPDGRFVTFQSISSNLVPGDTNEKGDIFVRDRRTQTTTRVSVASDGTQGNNYSYESSISADGRFVAFSSSASNLVPGDTNARFNTFVRDLATQKTTLVSIASDGTPGNGYFGAYRSPSISADGRFVAFHSDATNLVPGDTNASTDEFVHDRTTKTTTLVSIASDGTPGNGPSDYPSLSADGRFVAFASFATNLVPGDTNATSDVFVHDRTTKTTTRVSVASDGTQGNSFSRVEADGALSADGRFVAFLSHASNLVPGDTNALPDIFVHDRVSKITSRVSVASDGTEGNGRTFKSTISADGRFVTFWSPATNLVPGDTNGTPDLFVHNRNIKTTTRANLTSNGAQDNNGSGNFATASISADGRFVAFFSFGTNLVAGDTNGETDMFVRDRLLESGQSADLAVTQTESADPVLKGDPLTYTVRVKNNGADPAANVSLVDLVPLNALLKSVIPSQGGCYKGPISVCRLGSLNAGNSATVKVNFTANKLGVLKNTAFGNAPPKDDKAGNNTSKIFTKVE